jgi:hypothetical protein
VTNDLHALLTALNVKIDDELKGGAGLFVRSPPGMVGYG